jgi:hypothetical protein
MKGMKGTDSEGRESRRSRLISAWMASQRFVWCKAITPHLDLDGEPAFRLVQRMWPHS